jgi:hypothetical protein
MNWIFESYSNVYQTAMMQDVKTVRRARRVKTPVTTRLKRLFGRG